MEFPQNLKYTKTHEWVLFSDEKTAKIGITDYAQQELGDLVYVNLPAEGDAVTAGGSFAEVESVKAVSDVYSPVSGTTLAANEELADAPQKINEAPYDAWFVEVGDITDTEELLDAAAYEAYVASL